MDISMLILGVKLCLGVWLIGWLIGWLIASLRALGIHHGPRFYLFLLVMNLFTWPGTLRAELQRLGGGR